MKTGYVTTFLGLLLIGGGGYMLYRKFYKQKQVTAATNVMNQTNNANNKQATLKFVIDYADWDCNNNTWACHIYRYENGQWILQSTYRIPMSKVSELKGDKTYLVEEINTNVLYW